MIINFGERVVKDGIHRVGVGHIAGQHDRCAEFLRKALDSLAKAIADIGHREFGALTMRGARDAVGDRAVAEQTRDEDSFSG